MTWFRLDDDFADHDKVLALEEGPCPDAAIATWTRCASWSSHADKGGFVPGAIALRYARGKETVLSELVRVGLWTAERGGYQFHDWQDYNPSGERLEEKRRLAAARKAKYRAKLSSARTSTPPSEPKESDDVAQERVPNADGTHLERQENALAALGDRERDLGDLNSSSESEIACAPEQPDEPAQVPTEPPPGAEVVDMVAHSRRLAAIGYEWVLRVRGNGTAPDLTTHREWYEKIGRKPQAEREIVARNAALTTYLTEKPSLRTPKHFETYWESFLEGPRNGLSGGKPGPAKRGPAPLASKADYDRAAGEEACF